MSATYPIGSINNKDQKISELRSRLDSLLKNSKDYDSLNNRYKQLLQDFSSLNEAKLRLEYEIRQRESEYNRHIYDLKSENETLKLGLNTKVSNTKKMFNENDIIEREIKLKNEEIENLNEKLNDVSYQFDKDNKNQKDLVLLAQNLNSDLIRQNDQIEKLKEDNICLTMICQENERLLKRGENDIQILSNHFEENDYDLQNLNKKVNLHENLLNNLTNKLTSCKENNLQLQNRIKKLEKEFDDNREENVNLKNEIIDERTLRINAENDNQKLKNILMRKETQLEQLNNENEKMKIINDEYNNNKEKNKIQNDKLKNQVMLLESQNENIIKEIDKILSEDKKAKNILKRKERITSLLKNNNDTLEKSINDLDSFINKNNDYILKQQISQVSPRFTYSYEQQ